MISNFKALKSARKPGESVSKMVTRLWPNVRDDFKRKNQRTDGSFECFHCEKIIWSWEYAVVDHFPVPKGRDITRALDPNNLVISHAHCNVTSSKDRRRSLERHHLRQNAKNERDVEQDLKLADGESTPKRS